MIINITLEKIMCGRFTLTLEMITITERFDVPFPAFEWSVRYNIAPTQTCPIIVQENKSRSIVPMSWGLIPHWSQGKKSKYSLINAKSETAKSKPLFRELFKSKRCLVPADGFFEWKHAPKGKIPFRITMKDNSLFAFAALWDVWKDEKGAEVKSFTILTTAANSLLSQLHDRMPAILKKEQEWQWLDPEMQDVEKLESLLIPYPAEEMKLYEVSPIVNSWKNESKECILPST
jgi:putative SOS response-associated peptidase YedK